MEGRPRDSQRRLYDAEDAVDHGRQLPSVADVGAFVEEVMGSRWVRARWGERQIEVKDGRGRRKAGGTRHFITMPIWARNEMVTLHELAHGLTPGGFASHGPEYAGLLLELVRQFMGPEAGKALAESYRSHRVRKARTAIPRVRYEVAARADLGRKRATNARTPSRHDAREAAEAIRRAVKAGAFGPAGRKPRAHALATARALEAM